MEKIYNKLVRDNIPEIIKNNNQTPYTRILNEEEYRKALEDKFIEEYREITQSSGNERLEELADMLELIRTCAELEKSSLERIIEIANNKKDKRGGFSEKIYLEKVVDNENVVDC